MQLGNGYIKIPTTLAVRYGSNKSLKTQSYVSKIGNLSTRKA